MLQQLSVFVENKVGSLREVTSVLSKQGISLKAISSFDSPDFCILRIVVDQPEKAKEVLTKKGFAVKVTPVLAVELEDKPGELDRVLGVLADNGLNINYVYSFVLRGEKEPLMIMNLNDLPKATQILKQHGITLVD